MDEEVLLHMYREAWNSFLEAYREKDIQNQELIRLIGGVIDLEMDEKNKEDLKTQLGLIIGGI